MNEKLNQLKELIAEWLQEVSPANEAMTDLHVAMWDVLSSVLAERESNFPPLSHISAEEVRLVVKDETSGRVFLRHLPLEYSESSNGVILKGETFAGQPTKIVFLSEFALGKLLELQGQGQDEPVCDGHHSHDHEGETHEHHNHHRDSCDHGAHASHDHLMVDDTPRAFSSRDKHEQSFYPLLGHDDGCDDSMCDTCPERNGCDVSSGEFAKQ